MPMPKEHMHTFIYLMDQYIREVSKLEEIKNSKPTAFNETDYIMHYACMIAQKESIIALETYIIDQINETFEHDSKIKPTLS